MGFFFFYNYILIIFFLPPPTAPSSRILPVFTFRINKSDKTASQYLGFHLFLTEQGSQASERTLSALAPVGEAVSQQAPTAVRRTAPGPVCRKPVPVSCNLDVQGHLDVEEILVLSQMTGHFPLRSPKLIFQLLDGVLKGTGNLQKLPSQDTCYPPPGACPAPSSKSLAHITLTPPPLFYSNGIQNKPTKINQTFPRHHARGDQ